MKFTNERISNADREKYQTMGIDFGIAEDWAINQDRDIFLMITGNYREEPDFPPYKFNDWLYFYKGKVMEFSSCIYLRIPLFYVILFLLVFLMMKQTILSLC